MSDKYFWCQLENGNKQTVGYIEERGAKEGNLVEMVDLDGEMWTVTRVTDPAVEKAYVRQQEKIYKNFQASLKGGGVADKS